jgi:conjugal transfer pilus assembly protein TraB
MDKIKHRLLKIREKLKSFFKGSNVLESRAIVKRKQLINLVLVLVVLFISLVVFLVFIGEVNKPEKKAVDKEDTGAEYQKIELATDATGADTKWRNFLEESIETESKNRTEQIEILKSTLNKQQQEDKEQSEESLKQLNSRLSYALQAIEQLKIDKENMKTEIASLNPEEKLAAIAAELGMTTISTTPAINAPVSSYSYIPATSYVSGHLLGGIAVSTSVNTQAEPIPVVIKLTGRGNLPKDFAVDIKQCRLLGSCYGDISSERAIIRAEELVCEDKEAGLVISTKVAGVIYGDDGANGIRGVVVSMSDKHLKSAFIGGVLSGFSNTAKNQNGLNISPLGAISTNKKNIQDIAQDGILGGGSSAAEKLADYYIKQAENISPVILVPGGTKVDVVFTKSVEVGASDVAEAIKGERSGQ